MGRGRLERERAREDAAIAHLGKVIRLLRRSMRIMRKMEGDGPAWPPLEEDSELEDIDVVELLVRDAKRRGDVGRPPASRRRLPAGQKAGFLYMEAMVHDRAADLVGKIGPDRGNALAEAYLSVLRGATPAEVEAAARRATRLETARVGAAAKRDAAAA